jgi:predicted RNA-binding Zn ribbon-like protein
MGATILQHVPDQVTPYRYVGGDRSIDFVNTVAWVSWGPDRFTSYDRVLEWAEGSETISHSGADSLRALGDEYPARAVRVLAEAISLRRLLERLFFRISQRESAGTEIAELNEKWLTGSLTELSLVQTGTGSFELGWPRAGQALESPLWIVARSAALLLASSDVARIKRCGGTGCGWYYVDRSRNGLRRWCEMETCGTSMKSLRRAERIAASRGERTPAAS